MVEQPLAESDQEMNYQHGALGEQTHAVHDTWHRIQFEQHYCY
jgi:hypothetical protein